MIVVLNTDYKTRVLKERKRYAVIGLDLIHYVMEVSKDFAIKQLAGSGRDWAIEAPTDEEFGLN